MKHKKGSVAVGSDAGSNVVGIQAPAGKAHDVPSGQPEWALMVAGVSKSFGGVHAVRSVDFSVPVGSRCALIGPNGAGKSTLFNLIAGELRVDAGRIRLFGHDVTGKGVRQRARLGLGRTYQISELFLQLTVEQNLLLATLSGSGLEFGLLRPWRVLRPQLDWVRQVAEQVDLADYLGSPVKDLSHGLQRQLELGMALAMRPRLIMLDEPAAGLSPGERRRLADLIKALPREITLVLIEHDMDIVLDVADRISVLHEGRLIAEDTPEGIRTNRQVQEVYLGQAYS